MMLMKPAASAKVVLEKCRQARPVSRNLADNGLKLSQRVRQFRRLYLDASCAGVSVSRT